MTYCRREIPAMTTISTYATWAKARDKKCRRFSHRDEHGVDWYRVTDRRSILLDAGFRMGAEILYSASDLPPREAVRRMYDGAHALIVYYCTSAGELIVWFKD